MQLQKQLTPGQITSLHIDMGSNICWNKSNTVLVSQMLISSWPAWKENEKPYHLDYTDKAFVSTIIQMQGNHLYQIKWKAILDSIMVMGLKLLKGNMSPYT